jgi:hypothetical protein
MPYLRMEGERRVACMGRLARPAAVRKNKRGLAGCSIVGKMDEWMTLCDSLGQQPSENEQTSRKVLKTALQEALWGYALNKTKASDTYHEKSSHFARSRVKASVSTEAR